MRRFFIFSTVIVLILAILLAGAGYALASGRPFLPGNPIFPVQAYAEQYRARMIGNDRDRAFYFLELVEQRTLDLATLAGSPHELLALNYLDQALDQAIRAAMNVPPEDEAIVNTRLTELVAQIEGALNLLTVLPQEHPDVLADFQAKVQALRVLLTRAVASTDEQNAVSQTGSNIPRDSTVDDTGIDPLAVPFLPGSGGALHGFYPLVGQHATLDCAACHIAGQYAGTPTLCETCHVLDKPANHFNGDCAACHTPLAWNEVNFDHALAGSNDCESCHTADKPTNHYNGQCSLCHNTTTWKNAAFNHLGVSATNCLSCHAADKPANHYDGQCSLCHNPNTWKAAVFNHAAVGATDCQSCHTADKPANHYSGQCSTCHNLSTWKGASFNHTAVGATDCQSCHTADKPANHYSGQCSTCHSTVTWAAANFNHSAGATDCQSCHTADKPSNHYTGQCSTCHNTSNWGDASFNHSGYTNCISCHASDAPSGHYSGQCSTCHNTSNWFCYAVCLATMGTP